MHEVSRGVGRAYVLSPHPFVLGELVHQLASSGTTPEAIRLPFSVAPSFQPPPVESEAIFIVDACYPTVTTESLVSRLRSACPKAQILVLAEELNEAFALPLLQLGVKGLVTYASARQQLLPATTAVSKRGCWVPRALLSRFVDGLLAGSPPRTVPSLAGLSRREQDVLASLLQSLSNKEIGDKLHISERTVKFHVSNLLSKFSVQRRADLILQSFQANLRAS